MSHLLCLFILASILSAPKFQHIFCKLPKTQLFSAFLPNSSPCQLKNLGIDCTPTAINPNTTFVQQQHNSRMKTEESVETQQNSDTESQQQFEDQILSNDEQSSEQSNDASMSRPKSYPAQRSKLSSPKSSSENTLEDRRMRRQIANCNERRRMQVSATNLLTKITSFLVHQCRLPSTSSIFASTLR
jgi:hypothetical protein